MLRGCFELFFILGLFLKCSTALTCPSDVMPTNCTINQNEFNEEYAIALANLTATLQILKNNFNQSGFTMTPDIPAADHFKSANVPQISLNDDIISSVVDKVFDVLSKRYSLRKNQLVFCLNAAGITLGSFCPIKPTPDCSQVKSYTYDGLCNNLDNPYWGATGQPFNRIFPDGYEADGKVSHIRLQKSSRFDSLLVNTGKGASTAGTSFPGFNSDVSTALTQIITHDLMSTGKWQPFPGTGYPGVSCCNPSNNQTIASWIKMNKWCMPVTIDNSDPCFPNNVTCLQYTRLLKSLDNCNLTKPAAPMNFHTAFLDCEIFYNPLSKQHRDANFGKYNVDNYTQMQAMLDTYDHRTSMTPILFRIIICYLRVHNIIFDEFRRNFPTLSNDAVANETQKFVCGAYQAINVNYITSILPTKFGTFLQNLGKCYDKTLNPQVSVSFASCFRGMHIFMRDSLATYSESFFTGPNPLQGKSRTEIDLRDCVMNTTFYRDNKCGLTHGCLDTTWNIGPVGPNVNCMYFAPNKTTFGTDLMALDQQYDNDAGAPSWVSILRTVYNVKKCDANYTQTDMTTLSASNQAILWQRCNGSLADLGFLVAAGMEDTNGEILAPTCSFVIADQVKRFICGDRFFVNHHPFISDNQRNLIAKLTFFNLLCLCEDCFGARFQKNPFLSAAQSNLKIQCPANNTIVSSFNLATWFN